MFFYNRTTHERDKPKKLAIKRLDLAVLKGKEREDCRPPQGSDRII